MFYSTAWDPRFIIYQIFAVQSLFYLQFGVFLLLFDQLVGNVFSVEQIFNYRLTNTDASYGWVVIIASFVNAVCGYLLPSTLIQG